MQGISHTWQLSRVLEHIDHLTHSLSGYFANCNHESVLRVRCFIEALAHARGLFPTYGPIVELAILPDLSSASVQIDSRVSAFFNALIASITSATFDFSTACTVNHLMLASEPHAAFESGRIRTSQNWIGSIEAGLTNARYVPPSASSVTHLVEELFDRTDYDRMHPILGAAMFYCDFVNIHPFWDANGRTALALAYRYVSGRLPFSAVPPLSRKFYVSHQKRSDALKEFLDRPMTWLAYFSYAWLHGLRQLFQMRTELVRTVQLLSDDQNIEDIALLCARDRHLCKRLRLWQVHLALGGSLGTA